MKLPLLALLLLAAGLGCATIDAGAEREALLRTDREFSQASVARGASDAFFTYAAEGASLLPMREQPVTGREAIRASMNELPAGSVLVWTPQRAEVSRAGDLGYTTGTYEFRSKDEAGKAKVTYGKYVTVWRKQPDGSWKLVLDIGNPSPPPAGAGG